MGAPKTPKNNELEYNGRTSNKKGAGQKKIGPRIKGAPINRYFRVFKQQNGFYLFPCLGNYIKVLAALAASGATADM